MRKTEKKETSFMVKLAVFAAAAFAVITLVSLQLKYNEYKFKRDQLRAEVDELQDRADELQDIADADADRDYIIEVAKNKLNLRLPEEVIFYNDLFN